MLMYLQRKRQVATMLIAAALLMSLVAPVAVLLRTAPVTPTVSFAGDKPGQAPFPLSLTRGKLMLQCASW